MTTRVGTFVGDDARHQYETLYATALRELPPARRTQLVDTSFGRACCYEFGASTGVPLVLLAGRNAATPSWAPNIPSLSARHRIISIDPIGEAGRSTQTAPLTEPAHQGQWVDEALAGLDVSAVHLVGASLGGWTAMQTALRSARIRSVTVVDPPATFARLRPSFIAAGLLAQTSLVTARRRQRILAWIAGGDDTDSTQARLGVAARGYRVRQAPPTPLSDDQLRSVTIPVLALLAGRSRVHDPAAAASRARLLPSGTVETWPDAGHAMNAQFPDRFADRVSGFVDSLTTR